MNDEERGSLSLEAARRAWQTLRASGQAPPAALLRAARKALAWKGLGLGQDELARQVLFLSFCLVCARRNDRLERKYRPLLAEEALRPDCGALRAFFEEYFGVRASRARRREPSDGEQRHAAGAVVLGAAGTGKQTHVLAAAASLGLAVERVDFSRQSIVSFVKSHAESVQNWDVKLSFAQPPQRGKRPKAATGCARPAPPPHKFFLFTGFDYFNATALKPDRVAALAELRRLAAFARRSRFPFVLTAEPRFAKFFDAGVYAQLEPPPLRSGAVETLFALVGLFETRLKGCCTRKGSVAERLSAFFAAAERLVSSESWHEEEAECCTMIDVEETTRPDLALMLTQLELRLLCGEEPSLQVAPDPPVTLEQTDLSLDLQRLGGSKQLRFAALQRDLREQLSRELELCRIDQLTLGFFARLREKGKIPRGRRAATRTLQLRAQLAAQLLETSLFNWLERSSEA